MQKGFRVVFFLLLLLHLPLLNAAQPDCRRVAEMAELDFSAPAGGWAIEVGSFILKIPVNPHRTILDGADLTLVYSDGAVLVLGFGPVPPSEAASRAASLIPALIFGEPLCDEVDPQADPVRFLATVLKQSYFDRARRVWTMHSEALTYYVSDSQWQGFSGRAFVTSKRFPNRYLRIDAKGMDFGLFRNIVLSTREE